MRDISDLVKPSTESIESRIQEKNRLMNKIIDDYDRKLIHEFKPKPQRMLWPKSIGKR